jgi:hypothetical protein
MAKLTLKVALVALYPLRYYAHLTEPGRRLG